MITKSLSYYLGNALIVISLLGLSYIFYPVLAVYLFPPPQVVAQDIKDQQFTLSIPKIHALGKVVKNVDPFDKEAYTKALKTGIAHAKGTYLPDQMGTIFLFAHSSGLPWELTRNNTIFLRLNELEKNDEIALIYEGKKYVYSVTGKKEVWPTDISYLKDLRKDQLILQTCTPIGTDMKRLLVFARPMRD